MKILFITYLIVLYIFCKNKGKSWLKQLKLWSGADLWVKNKKKEVLIFLKKGCANIVHINSTINQVQILKDDSKEPPKTFSFDFVFGADSLQSLVY